MSAKPYYSDEVVTLYHGDCRDITEWLAADVLVTDPPYGRGWKQGRVKKGKSDAHPGIANDRDTTTRDAVLALWDCRRGLAIAFGDLMLAPPPGTKQTLAYLKAPDSGGRGAMGGFRRDIEAVYLIGAWPTALGGRSSLLTTGARLQGTQNGTAGRYGHPHAKPVDVMETLIAACPPGIVADPFAGGGSTLVAARNLGRRAIGVEVDEAYCEQIAKRLAQGALELNPLAVCEFCGRPTVDPLALCPNPDCQRLTSGRDAAMAAAIGKELDE